MESHNQKSVPSGILQGPVRGSKAFTIFLTTLKYKITANQMHGWQWQNGK